MALAWNAGWVNALRGSNPLSSAAESLWSALCRPQALFFVAGTPSRFQVGCRKIPAQVAWHTGHQKRFLPAIVFVRIGPPQIQQG